MRPGVVRLVDGWVRRDGVGSVSRRTRRGRRRARGVGVVVLLVLGRAGVDDVGVHDGVVASFLMAVGSRFQAGLAAW